MPGQEDPELKRYSLPIEIVSVTREKVESLLNQTALTVVSGLVATTGLAGLSTVIYDISMYGWRHGCLGTLILFGLLAVPGMAGVTYSLISARRMIDAWFAAKNEGKVVGGSVEDWEPYDHGVVGHDHATLPLSVDLTRMKHDPVTNVGGINSELGIGDPGDGTNAEPGPPETPEGG